MSRVYKPLDPAATYTQDQLPQSGTLCWCQSCGDLFRSWPNQAYCEKHRKPRVRLVNGKWVTV